MSLSETAIEYANHHQAALAEVERMDSAARVELAELVVCAPRAGEIVREFFDLGECDQAERDRAFDFLWNELIIARQACAIELLSRA